MGKAVVHFEIEGRDGEALQAFYSQLFGWDFMRAPDVRAYGLVRRESNLSAEGVGIGGAVYTVPEQPSPTWRGPSRADGYNGHVTVYVEVPDVEAALAEVERLGGTRMQGPDAIGGGQQMGKFTDPEGHLVGIVSPTPPPA
jgi:uncharacterized protein